MIIVDEKNKKYDISYLSNDNRKKLKELIKRFNSSFDINYKLKLSYEIIKLVPNFIFGTCRICKKHIIYSYEKLILTKDNCIRIFKPEVFIRKVDDIEYHLSCCEICMLKYFKDNPPKTRTLIFSKGQKYFSYIFNIPENISKQIRSQTTSVSLNSMIRKYGEIEGNNKWDKYRKKQAYTCSQEYFINKYGEKLGNEKYENYVIKRNESLYKYNVNKKEKFSHVSLEFFLNLYDKIKQYNHEIYFQNHNKEYEVYYKKENDPSTHCFFLDFYDKTINLVIEFLGDFWHGNPKIYNDDKIIKRNITVKDVHEYNNQRKQIIIEKLNNPFYIEIWESDYYHNKESIINDIIQKFYAI